MNNIKTIKWCLNLLKMQLILNGRRKSFLYRCIIFVTWIVELLYRIYIYVILMFHGFRISIIDVLNTYIHIYINVIR